MQCFRSRTTHARFRRPMSAALRATLVVLCAVVSGSSPAALADTGPDVREYRIGPEDVLDIAVWKNPDLGRVVPVRPDGKISLPLINDVLVEGLTPTELREVLAQQFLAYISAARVSVIVREIHSFKVSVIGNVRKPGRYELKSRATVLDLLALAEGFQEFAARRRIQILRQDGPTSQRLRFDYDAVVSDGNGDGNVPVRPGDVIVVP